MKGYWRISQTDRFYLGRQTRKPGARTNQNPNFRVVRVPVEPLMDHGWCSHLASATSKETWLPCLPESRAAGQLIGRAWDVCHGPDGMSVVGGRGSNTGRCSIDFLCIDEDVRGGWWVFLIYMPNTCIGSDERQECRS